MTEEKLHPTLQKKTRSPQIFIQHLRIEICHSLGMGSIFLVTYTSSSNKQHLERENYSLALCVVHILLIGQDSSHMKDCTRHINHTHVLYAEKVSPGNHPLPSMKKSTGERSHIHAHSAERASLKDPLLLSMREFTLVRSRFLVLSAEKASPITGISSLIRGLTKE